MDGKISDAESAKSSASINHHSPLTNRSTKDFLAGDDSENEIEHQSVGSESDIEQGDQDSQKVPLSPSQLNSLDSPKSRSPSLASNCSRSRSKSPSNSPRSRALSHKSRSTSPRSHSNSPQFRSPSLKSRSRSPNSRSVSPESPTSPKLRSVSPKSRTPSPKSRSISPKSRSPSPQSRSPSPESSPEKLNIVQERDDVTKEVFGASDSENEETRGRSKSRSPSITRSENRSRSRSKSVSRSRSRSKSVSRSRSRSKSKSIRRSRFQSKSKSKSKSPSRSRSRSKSLSRSRSRSTSRSKSGSRSRSRSRSGSRSSSNRSHSGSRSLSGSRASSRSRSRSRSTARSRSISRSRSRSGSRSVSRSRSRSRSKSGSGSESGSSPSRRKRSLSGSDSDVGRRKVKKKRRSGDSRISDSDSDSKRSPRQRSRKRRLSGSESDRSISPKSHDKDRQSLSRSQSPAGNKDENGTAPEDSNKHTLSDSEDEAIRENLRRGIEEPEFVNDFEMMMERKKQENAGKRRRKMNVDLINDNEEHISVIVKQMREAAELDRCSNQNQQPAVKKIGMLTFAMNQLKKYDLIEGFLDANVLTALTDWLAPMPDKSLPSVRIRDSILRWLLLLPPLNQDMLKTSGIGKAVMYLYKHPKELKENKDRCGRLIAMWSRPIFNNSDDFKTLTKEERLHRDLELQKQSGVVRKEEKQDDTNPVLRPGDPGWCYRARVPRPSNKDYVNRPKWQVDTEIRKGKKKEPTRFDKQIRAFKEKQKQAKARHAVKISIEGRNMAL